MPIVISCTRIRTLYPALRICIGSGRNLAEIAGCAEMTAQDRIRVTAQARAGLAQLMPAR